MDIDSLIAYLVTMVVCGVVWFAIGVSMARSRSVALYRQARKSIADEYPITKYSDSGAAARNQRMTDRLHRGLMSQWVRLWLFMAVAGWYRDVLDRPLVAVRAEAAEAREAAETWESVQRAATDPREQELAAELARLNRRRAAELDL